MSRRKCPTKWKVAHATRAEAEKHLGGLRAKGKGRGEHVYQCPNGEHWHVGSAVVHGRSNRSRREARR